MDPREWQDLGDIENFKKQPLTEALDIAIVGAGAAGLVTAIWAGRRAQVKRKALRILLLDTRQKIGAKILMSGGTRCNVTHQEVKPSDFQGGQRHFIKHVLEAFPPRQTLQFFKEIGVRLVLEPTGKFFPATHSAQTVLEALLKEAARTGVTLKTGVRIVEIKKTAGLFHLKNSDGTYQMTARKVVLTTGGRSYPTTGSDGTGYGIAKSLGHTIVPTFPALTPLLTDDENWKDLSGVSLEAKLSFFRNGKKIWECRDSFLFTHFGFSGTAALNMSRHFALARPEEAPQIVINFLPREDEESFAAALQSAQRKSPGKLIRNLLAGEFHLPERFAETFLKKIGVAENESIGKCSAADRKRLTRSLLNYPLKVTGVFGYKKAEVTAGGADLKEVKVSTMESRLVDGLYFAGEILDVDGRIGGFNFQWAWSTGAVAGRSAAESLIS